MVQGINFENNIQKKMAQEGLLKSVGKSSFGKTLAGYTPFVGDAIDFGTGIYNIGHGHPIVGTGQAILGGVGIGMDAAALAAAPYTGGASILGEQALKQAGRKLLKVGGRKAIKYFSKSPVKGSLQRTGASMGLEVIPLVTRNSSNDNINTTDTNTNTNNTNKASNVMQRNQNNNYGGLPPIEQLIASASKNQVPMDKYNDSMKDEDLSDYEKIYNALQGVDLDTLENQKREMGYILGKSDNGINVLDLINYYQTQQQQLNQPYIDALQNYLDNYGEYTKGSRNAQRFYTALAGLSGNAGYKDLAKQYDPMQLELNRIQLVKALQEAKAGNVGNINEIIGNATIAQAMGLDPQAALANKNLLNAFTAQQKAQYGLQGRMYGADQSYNARVYSANLDNATKYAIAKGRMDLAVKLQQMKGNAGAVNALINTVGFGGSPEKIIEAVEQFGNPTGLQFVRPQQQDNGTTQGGAPISGLKI